VTTPNAFSSLRSVVYLLPILPATSARLSPTTHGAQEIEILDVNT
jgi:hypothetical protein